MPTTTRATKTTDVIAGKRVLTSLRQLSSQSFVFLFFHLQPINIIIEHRPYLIACTNAVQLKDSKTRKIISSKIIIATMDTPEVQIRPIIHALTQGSREDRQEALEKYFLPNAYFVHPFCRVPSFDNYDVPFTNSTVSSRWFISLIYEWYRILSPDIKISIDSTGKYLYILYYCI